MSTAETLLATQIEQARLPVNGEQIHAPQSDPAKREGVVGMDPGISRSDTEAAEARLNGTQKGMALA